MRIIICLAMLLLAGLPAWATDAPAVRSLPWDFSAASPQGFAGAKVEIETACYRWTIGLVFRLATDPTLYSGTIEGTPAGTLVMHHIERAVKDPHNAACR